MKFSDGTLAKYLHLEKVVSKKDKLLKLAIRLAMLGPLGALQHLTYIIS